VRNLLIIFFIFSFLIFSCDLFNINDSDKSGNFWAIDYKTGMFYRVDAELLSDKSEYCNVWVEKGSGISKEIANEIADEYDKKIRGIMIENFSMEDIIFHNNQYSDTLALADALGNNDGKLCILLLDIRDTYEKGGNDSYVAGYFFPADLERYYNSNMRDIIYIDTNPGMIDVFPDKMDTVYKTLVHEMQHLMNYTSSKVKRNGSQMDTWIDEGLSAAAEYIYSGHSDYRLDWFRYNGSNPSNDLKNLRGVIDQGNNFFVWNNRRGNDPGQSPYAVLDDYATVYLFFQWLRIHQEENQNIYRDIITSAYSDYRAVTTSFGNKPWEDILMTWLAANYINAKTGLYGYKDDPELKNIMVPAPASIGTSVQLAPGEGVYSKVSVNPDVTSTAFIGYKYMTSTINSSFQANSVLLTFNKNTGKTPALSTGATTGVPIQPAVNNVSLGRSLLPSNYAPYPIGAGDL